MQTQSLKQDEMAIGVTVARLFDEPRSQTDQALPAPRLRARLTATVRSHALRIVGAEQPAKRNAAPGSAPLRAAFGRTVDGSHGPGASRPPRNVDEGSRTAIGSVDASFYRIALSVDPDEEVDPRACVRKPVGFGQQ